MSGQTVGWIDTHCHLQLLDEPPAEVVDDARAAGVTDIVCVGIDAATSAIAVDAARSCDGVHATVGLHPHAANDMDAEIEQLVALLSAPEVVAVGECGLDFYRNRSPREDQDRAFRRQIALAKEHDLALVVHTRDAWDTLFSILDAEGCPARTVFHCFTGGPAEARRCVDSFGAWLSIAGPISYPRNDLLREAVRAVPLGHLVVETDSPFLSPQAFRGKTNYPARAALVGESLAAALGRSAPEVAEVTSRNAAVLFGLGRG
ncbi:MAG: TatD family hydrolase [Acidimicrobiia bacterium]|nr:TatD family hydrolase [Acidimicrobiia bacterium]